MENTEFISADDPDLEMFESLIACSVNSFLPFRDGSNPSYAHEDFYSKSLEIDMLPGNNSPYCPIALGIFGEIDYYNYESECFEFLKRSSKKFALNTFEGVVQEFEELINTRDLESLYQPARNVCTNIFNLCDFYCQTLIKNGKEHTYGELQQYVTNKSKSIAIDILKIADSDELNKGQVKSLSRRAKYAILVLTSIQITQQFFKPYIEQFIAPNLKFIYGGEKTAISELSMSMLLGPRAIILHVLTSHSITLQKSLRPNSRSRKKDIKSPADFIYVEISGSHKASEIKCYIRWLFIKVWAFSYLQKKDANLSKLAKEIAEDDRFYYLDNMQLAGSIKDDNYRSEFKLDRAKTILNEFSKWKGYQGDDGYISSKILEKESRRKSNE